MATHYLSNYTNNGINPPTDTAGSNSAGGPPGWQWQTTVGYAFDPFTLTAAARGISSGLLTSTYIQCTVLCPPSTTNNETINDNHVAGAIYFDSTISYKIAGKGGPKSGTELFLRVENIANRAPPPVAAGSNIGGALIGTNPTLYDVIGRTFRVGVRFAL